jgi:RimJ/RimL family protein N-acetyltransferase
MTNLYTNSTVVRAFEAEDVEHVYSQLGSSDDLREATTPYWRPMSRADVHAHLLGPNKPDHTWGICTKQDHQLIGKVDVIDLNMIHKRASVGITIWADECRGLGYGSEVISTVADWLMRTVGVRRVQAIVMAHNQPSLAAFKRAGFEQEARLRDYYWVDGKYDDAIVLSRLNVYSMQESLPE